MHGHTLARTHNYTHARPPIVHLRDSDVQVSQGIGPAHELEEADLGVKRVVCDGHLTGRPNHCGREPRNAPIGKDPQRGGVFVLATDHPYIVYPENTGMLAVVLFSLYLLAMCLARGSPYYACTNAHSQTNT